MHKLSDIQVMYTALLERDSTFDGIFFVGVKTTGIFCRSTCPAKKPKAQNVEYFASPQDALGEGYRPCKRCRPLDENGGLPDDVQWLLDLLEQTPNGRLSDADLKDLGIDPSTARRQFQRHFGMTFHAYQRGRRMGQALREVRSGEAVISAQLNNGFRSASGFWEAFKRTFGTPASLADEITCFQARWIKTPLGAMLALADQRGLHLLEFADRRGLEKELHWLQKQGGVAIVPGENPYLEQIAEELDAYFCGSTAGFKVPLALAGSEFERAVWEILLRISPGQTLSYGEIAQELGRPGAARAVGRANGSNRLAIAVPCHRVVRSDGTLSGYGGGIWRKRWLLEHERVVAARGCEPEG